MTDAQRRELNRLIRALSVASRELGEVGSSIHWNQAYFKQQDAEKAIREYMETIPVIANDPKRVLLEGYLADVERPSGYEPTFTTTHPDERYSRQGLTYKNVRAVVALPKGFIATERTACLCQRPGFEPNGWWGCSMCDNIGFFEKDIK